MKLTLIFIISLLCVYELVGSERLHKQIYSSIEGGGACFRRLNGTHQAGCSSSDKGAVGVVQMVRDMNDAQWMVFNASAGPYMAIVSTAMFSNVIELFMEYPDNVAGLLIFNNATERVSSFTQESRCPNEYFSSDTQCSSTKAGDDVWNPQGTGLLRRDIPFPMFYLPESSSSEIDKIEACYIKYNLDKSNQKGFPLCSVQLNSFMFAAVNSQVCLRRSATSALLSPTKVCDPLGDYNVYYSLFPRTQNNDTQKNSVTLVTARLDTASLFDGLSPGAASSVVGAVTLLASAATLARMIPSTDANLYKNNVMWVLFNGEAFDYIGSQRVAYDLSKGAWPTTAPLAVADIALHVEVGQIGGALSAHADSALWPLTAYGPIQPAVSPEVTEFLNMMSEPVGYKSSANLPPSSLHSFRNILKEETRSGELPEVVLVDHNDTFNNLFYNSVLDEYNNIGFDYHNITIGSDGTFVTTEELLLNGTMKENEPQVKVARLATSLARALYQRVTGKPYDGNYTTSAHLVDEMLYCFLRSQDCRLLAAADYAHGGAEENPAPRAAPLYVGVGSWSNTATVFAAHLLALLAGQHEPLNKTQCDALQQPGLSHYWLRGWNHSGVCIQTTMNLSHAISPAFIIEDYDMSSRTYSTWTESVWQAMWARVFVRAGGGGARLAASAGGGATVLAALITFWLRRHAAHLFAHAPSQDTAASGRLAPDLRTRTGFEGATAV